MSRNKCDCGHTSVKQNTCEDCGKTYCDKCWANHKVTVKLDKLGRPVIVELHSAFVWDCDACGRENVVRPTTAEIDANGIPNEQREYLQEQLGMTSEAFDNFLNSNDNVVGVVTRVPAVVKCKHCEATYAAMPEGCEPEESDDE